MANQPLTRRQKVKAAVVLVILAVGIYETASWVLFGWRHGVFIR